MSEQPPKGMDNLPIRKQILFSFIAVVPLLVLAEILAFAAFRIIEKQWFSFSRISSERDRLAIATAAAGAGFAEKTFDFIANLKNAEIISEHPELIQTSSLTIDIHTRSVIYEYPNAQLVFRNIAIGENAKLKFGVGIDQSAWTQRGDGVLFEIILLDDQLSERLIFSQYIDPKNRPEDRRWFDHTVDLTGSSGKPVSLVFKTTAGPDGDRESDWGGWSTPHILSGGGREKTLPYFPLEIIHPYLGFVRNPEFNPIFRKQNAFENLVSEYGFLDEKAPILVPSGERAILGIFGGSLAGQFFTQGIESLIRELHKSPAYRNKEIVPVNIAMGGYKQPQQLLALNYLLTLGAHFDLVINIDGFNEIVLPLVDNLPDKVFPFFPRSWGRRVQDFPDPAIQLMVGEIAYLRSQRSAWASFFTRKPWGFSVTANLIWKIRDRRLAAALAALDLRVQSHKQKAESYVATGPPRPYRSESEIFADLASMWKMSSLQMQRLCAANGIKYFHFLQPNLYVPGSKPIGEAERKEAYLDGHPYKAPAEKGYPFLIEAGGQLISQGVTFDDLTMIFADKAELLYVDCCHVNQRGNELLGATIGQAIIRNILSKNNHRQ